MRTTDPGIQPISGALPITRRDCKALRHTLADGSLSMARVQDASPLRQRNSTGKFSPDFSLAGRNAPITAKAAPGPSSFSVVSVQFSTK